MNGYLQRLLDRAAPAPPAGATVLPTGLSHSPVSLADQRLNDPGFTDRYTPPADNKERFGDVGPQPSQPAPHRAQRPPTAESTLPEPVPIQPDPAPPQVAETAPEMPVTEVAAAPSQHPRPKGLVEPSDLELPQPEAAADTDETATTPPPAEQPVPPKLQVEPAEPSLTQVQQDSAPQRAPREIAEVRPSPPRPETESIAMAPAPDMPAPLQAPNESATPEPPLPVEAMPTPVEVPALPDMPLPAPRQLDPAPAPAPVVEALQEPPKPGPSAEKRPNRPMTASEASIVGQLTPRRRALTIFGLRRR